MRVEIHPYTVIWVKHMSANWCSGGKCQWLVQREVDKQMLTLAKLFLLKMHFAIITTLPSQTRILLVVIPSAHNILIWEKLNTNRELCTAKYFLPLRAEFDVTVFPLLGENLQNGVFQFLNLIFTLKAWVFSLTRLCLHFTSNLLYWSSKDRSMQTAKVFRNQEYWCDFRDSGIVTVEKMMRCPGLWQLTTWCLESVHWALYTPVRWTLYTSANHRHCTNLETTSRCGF